VVCVVGKRQAVVLFQYLVGHSGKYEDFKKSQESKITISKKR